MADEDARDALGGRVVGLGGRHEERRRDGALEVGQEHGLVEVADRLLQADTQCQ